MKTIGAVLIIVGFLLGVFTGIRFSTRGVIISDKNEVKQDKQMQVSLIGSVSVLMVTAGVIMFFCAE